MIKEVSEIAHISQDQAKLALVKNRWDIDRSVVAFIENPSKYNLSDQ